MKVLALVLVAVGAGVAVTAGAIALENAEGGGSPVVAPAVLPQRFVLEVVSSTNGPVIRPANIAVRPGAPVRVTIVNHTRTVHDFTAPALGVNEIILAGAASSPTRTVFTFTPPRAGVFAWTCPMPCGGYMGGHVFSFAPQPASAGTRWFPTT